MSGDSFPFIFLAVVAVAFWLLIIRPARARSRAQRAIVESAVPGARVLLASGIVGVIVSTGDEEFRVEIAPGVVITVVDQAVIRLLDPASPTAVGTTDSDGTSTPS